jgi:HAD superfamily hydrolase (TIGR01509 family)
VHDLRLVIFDCDGVLVDSEPISHRLIAELLSAEGLPTTPEEARRAYQGVLLAELVSDAESRLGRSLPDGWLASFERERAEVFRRELAPVVGAGEVVERVIASGVAVCVASQGKLEKTRLSLDLTALRRLFADGALFSAYSVERGKPYPDLFLHAAQRMGAEPASCVVVEDTPLGVRAGVSAGMRTLGYCANGEASGLRDAGAEVLRTLDELPRLLALE